MPGEKPRGHPNRIRTGGSVTRGGGGSEETNVWCRHAEAQSDKSSQSAVVHTVPSGRTWAGRRKNEQGGGGGGVRLLRCRLGLRWLRSAVAAPLVRGNMYCRVVGEIGKRGGLTRIPQFEGPHTTRFDRSVANPTLCVWSRFPTTPWRCQEHAVSGVGGAPPSIPMLPRSHAVSVGLRQVHPIFLAGMSRLGPCQTMDHAKVC